MLSFKLIKHISFFVFVGQLLSFILTTDNIRPNDHNTAVLNDLIRVAWE